MSEAQARRGDVRAADGAAQRRCGRRHRPLVVRPGVQAAL
jgi:hypothetical protein